MVNKHRADLQAQIEKLKRQHTELMRGRMVPSSRAQAVQRKILAIQDEITQLDRDAAERIALEKAPVDEILEVIAIPLLADVMNDLVAGVDKMLRRNGAQETVFSIYTQEIRRASLAIIDTLATSEEGLPKLLDVDDTLVDAIRKKLLSFIKQRLKIKK